jgi:hypothetical protein
VKVEHVLSTPQAALIDHCKMLIHMYQKDYIQKAEEDPSNAETITRDMKCDKRILELQAKIEDVYRTLVSTKLIVKSKAHMKKVVIFDEFAQGCPYFNSETDVNNGYGCDNSYQYETGLDDDGISRGKCYCWSCPLGIEPDEKDFTNPDVDWGGITKNDCTDSISGKFSTDGNYLMVDIEDGGIIKKDALKNYEALVNRYN